MSWNPATPLSDDGEGGAAAADCPISAALLSDDGEGGTAAADRPISAAPLPADGEGGAAVTDHPISARLTMHWHPEAMHCSFLLLTQPFLNES